MQEPEELKRGSCEAYQRLADEFIWPNWQSFNDGATHVSPDLTKAIRHQKSSALRFKWGFDAASGILKECLQSAAVVIIGLSDQYPNGRRVRRHLLSSHRDPGFLSMFHQRQTGLKNMTSYHAPLIVNFRVELLVPVSSRRACAGVSINFQLLPRKNVGHGLRGRNGNRKWWDAFRLNKGRGNFWTARFEAKKYEKELRNVGLDLAENLCLKMQSLSRFCHGSKQTSMPDNRESGAENPEPIYSEIWSINDYSLHLADICSS